MLFVGGWLVGGDGGGVELVVGLVVGNWLVGLAVLGWGKGSLGWRDGENDGTWREECAWSIGWRKGWLRGEMVV